MKKIVVTGYAAMIASMNIENSSLCPTEMHAKVLNETCIIGHGKRSKSDRKRNRKERWR